MQAHAIAVHECLLEHGQLINLMPLLCNANSVCSLVTCDVRR